MTLKTFLLFVTLDMLSRYQSTVNCRGRNVEGNFANKVNCRYSCHFAGLGLCSYLKTQRAGLLEEEKMAELLIQSTSWKFILELISGNVVISGEDVLMSY